MAVNDDALAPVVPAPDAAVTRPRPVKAWTVTGVVVAASIVVFLDKAQLGLVATQLIDELGLSQSAFGLISSASYLLYAVTCLIGGFTASRISPRWILLGCAVVWGFGQVPAMIATTGAMIYLSRLVVGAAEGPTVALSHVTAYSWFPNNRRGLPASLITAGAGLAKLFIAPGLTLIVVVYGWRASFVSVAVLALVWAVAWAFTGRMGPYAVERAAEDSRREPSVPWRRALLNRTFLGCLVAYLMQSSLAAVIYTWLPSYFQKGLGFSETVSGSLFGLPSAMAIVALLLVGSVSDRMLSRGVRSRFARAVLGGAVLAGAGLVLAVLPWVHVPFLAVAILMVGYGFSSTIMTAVNPAVAEIVPEQQQAGILGVLTALGTSGGVLSPFLVGVILDHADTPEAGYTLAFVIFGFMLVVGGIVFAVLADPEREAAMLRAV